MKQKEKGTAVGAPWASLGARVEAWRRTRTRRTGAMPAKLWREAAALAARFGVYRISQALRLNYENLKKHTSAGSGLYAKRIASMRRSFVEVVGVGEVGTREASLGAAQTEIEILSDGGARLRLRHTGGGVDLPGVVAAFLRETR